MPFRFFCQQDKMHPGAINNNPVVIRRKWKWWSDWSGFNDNYNHYPTTSSFSPIWLFVRSFWELVQPRYRQKGRSSENFRASTVLENLWGWRWEDACGRLLDWGANSIFCWEEPESLDLEIFEERAGSQSAPVGPRLGSSPWFKWLCWNASCQWNRWFPSPHFIAAHIVFSNCPQYWNINRLSIANSAYSPNFTC